MTEQGTSLCFPNRDVASKGANCVQRRSLSPAVSILKSGLCSHTAVGILQWAQYCGMGVGGDDKTPKIPPPSASEPQKTALNSKVPSLLGASNYQIAFYVGRFPEHSPFQFSIFTLCVSVCLSTTLPALKGIWHPMFSTRTLSTL